MATWSTSDMKKDGQTEWLVKTYNKTINGIRSVKGGLPSETEAILTVQTPLLSEMASVMRYRDMLPPGNNVPNGILKFLD